jgi:hypothetical protein
MSIAKHRASVLDSPTASQRSDQILFGQQLGIVTAAGGGAGQTVSTVVTFPEVLPANYQVIVSAQLAVVWWITARTAFGFTVNIAPLLAATTLGASSVDVLVIAA